MKRAFGTALLVGALAFGLVSSAWSAGTDTGSGTSTSTGTKEKKHKKHTGSSKKHKGKSEGSTTEAPK